MLREHLIPHGFLTQLHTPPMTHSERLLKELYLNLSERYQYPQFELLGPGQGAVFRDGESRACEIYKDRLVVREQPTHISIEEYLNQVAPIASEVQQTLKIPIWIVQQSVLRFLVPFGKPVAPLMKDHLFNMTEESLDSFGRPVLGLCLRIEFPPLPEDPTQMQLRIEPYFRDQKMIYLELSTRFLQPLQETEELRSRLTMADDFVKEKALAFLQESLSRSNR